MSVTLSPEVVQRLRQHAEAEAPRECVGALLGRDEQVVQVLPLVNSSATPERAFEVNAREYLRAESAAAAAKLEVVGFFHSHVDAEAVPSARDRAELQHRWLIIVPVRDGRAGEPRVFERGE